jgi:predicted amidohydrolase
MTKFIAAAIQMTSGDDIDANIVAAQALIGEAAALGASFIALPENAFYLRREGTVAHPDKPMAEHAGVRAMQELAKAQQVWILIGSIRAKEAGMDKPFNRSLLIGDDGRIAATYDKLHLFDVTLPGGQRYEESAQAVEGAGPVLVRAPFAKLGMSVCYDLRFPSLYRSLALAGAEILLVPSAFTRPTGEAHWRTLLTARAIENAAFVIAPAQCGTHPGGRETYGHSMIIDPWGKVLAEADGTHPGVIAVEIDLARVAEVRAQIPVLAHHRALGDVTIL